MQAVICRNGEDARRSIIQQQRPKGNEVLWRYMGIEKFVHMMLTRSIFVPKLGLFDDRREGGFIEGIFRRLYGRLDPEMASDAFRRAQDRFYALCFHGVEHENELMWRAYAPFGGVALVTTAEKLMRANFGLKDSDAMAREFYLLKVLYGDDYRGKLHPIAIKQGEYREEREFRMIFGAEGCNVRSNLSGEISKREGVPGIGLHFQPESMGHFVSEVRISPNNIRLVRDIVERLVPGSVPITASGIMR